MLYPIASEKKHCSPSRTATQPESRHLAPPVRSVSNQSRLHRLQRYADKNAEPVGNSATGKQAPGQGLPAGLPAAPTYGTTPVAMHAGALAKKKVTVNITVLEGGTASPSSAITYANDRVYKQADVEIVKGKETTLDGPKSKGILGNELIVDEYADPATPTVEEKKLLAENQSAGAITVYFVKGFNKGSLGEAFWASSGSGLIGVAVGTKQSDNSFSHELGHVLLDDGGHTVPDATYLMHATAPDPTKLTPAQITKIKGSPFAK